MKPTKVKHYVDKIKGHKHPIICMYSPMGYDGLLLYSGSADGWVYVWDLANKEVMHKVQLTINSDADTCDKDIGKYLFTSL
jgi:WD40 repeat protein